MPQVTTPRGAEMAHARRTELLASGLPIIEDDAYAELRFDGPPAPPLAVEGRAQVWHVGTFSKTLCPGLRLGWLVPPPRQLQRALRYKHDLDLQSNGLAQAIVSEFLRHDDFDARLVRLRRFYRHRCARLMAAVRRHLPSWRFDEPVGGFSLWLETGEALDDTDFLAEAMRHGVSFDPGRMFRPNQAGRPLALRLCYSLETADRLDQGVARLARAWDAFARRAARLPDHAARGPRVVRRRVSPRVRALRARSRRGGAAVDPLGPTVGVQAARRGRRARVQRGSRRLR